MQVKEIEVSILMDLYKNLLTEKQHTVMEMYYDEDFSLSEIADEIGISRQGVRDIIKKGEDELIYLEEKLGLYKKFKTIKSHADELLSVIESSDIPSELKAKIYDFAESVRLSV